MVWAHALARVRFLCERIRRRSRRARASLRYTRTSALADVHTRTLTHRHTRGPSRQAAAAATGPLRARCRHHRRSSSPYGIARGYQRRRRRWQRRSQSLAALFSRTYPFSANAREYTVCAKKAHLPPVVVSRSLQKQKNLI